MRVENERDAQREEGGGGEGGRDGDLCPNVRLSDCPIVRLEMKKQELS